MIDVPNDMSNLNRMSDSWMIKKIVLRLKFHLFDCKLFLKRTGTKIDIILGTFQASSTKYPSPFSFCPYLARYNWFKTVFSQICRVWICHKFFSSSDSCNRKKLESPMLIKFDTKIKNFSSTKFEHLSPIPTMATFLSPAWRYLDDHGCLDRIFIDQIGKVLIG